MQNLMIKKETIENYLKTNVLSAVESASFLDNTDASGTLVDFNPEEVSSELLRYILFNDTHLSNEIKSELTHEFLEKKVEIISKEENSIWDTKIKTLSDFWETCEKIKSLKYNADFEYLGRTFPVKMIVTIHNATKYEPKKVVIVITVKVCSLKDDFVFGITNNHILNLRREIQNLTFEKIMHVFKIFKQREDIDAYNVVLEKSRKLQRNNGKQILCRGIGLEYVGMGYGNKYLSSIHMDSFEKMSTAIIESDLELDDENSHRNINDDFRNKTGLPFIRVFSLLYKTYIYIHIDDVLDYKYDEKAFERIFLPADMKKMIQQVFSYSIKNLTGDILDYKHGGLIMMAEGNPGVGKTSTAEVYSELNKKPLYVVHVYEIGTDIRDIEKNLNMIFKRVEKWDAIILFDEIDVFLSKRNDNIEKSAVVGVFLRMMDYFRGIMFLTTNRCDVIDPAVLSRITLNVNYPDFTLKTRRKVWTAKLLEADLQIDSMDNLVKLDLNGRQIRNMVRLGKIIFTEHINEDKYIDLIRKTVPNFVDA
jgi:hypothetical protein